MKNAKKVTPAKRKPNKLFPGKRNYIGPQAGWFGFVHHGQMFERADCGNIGQRVEYIKSHKPAKEIPTRLRHLIYLGDNLNKKINDWDSGHCGRPNQDLDLKRAVMAYVRRHIDDVRWVSAKGSLCFANGRRFEG